MEQKLPYENLDVWKVSIELSKEIYQLSKKFPKDESYGLSSQIKRATISIALNIAEGKGRHSKKEFVHFLYVARGSLYEVLTCLQLSNELSFITEEELNKLKDKCIRIQFMLSKLIKSIQEVKAIK